MNAESRLLFKADYGKEYTSGCVFDQATRDHLLGIYNDTFPEPRDRNTTRFSQGKALYDLLPKGFRALIEKERKRANPEALILTLESPILADFYWEYIPFNTNVEPSIENTWQALPMLRSVPKSKHSMRHPWELPLINIGFFYDGDLHPVYLWGQLFTELPLNLKVYDCSYDEIPAMRDTFIEFTRSVDFLHIACHGKAGYFAQAQKGAFYGKNDPRRLELLPRVVLADCCHVAETTPDITWESTLLGRFIKETDGAAVWVGNIGRADYTGNEPNYTPFSYLLIQEFTKYPDRTFTKAIREVRSYQSRKPDVTNTQVIYVSSDWDADHCSLRDLLTKVTLPAPPPLPSPWLILVMFLVSLTLPLPYMSTGQLKGFPLYICIGLFVLSLIVSSFFTWELFTQLPRSKRQRNRLREGEKHKDAGSPTPQNSY